jgi:hypothetical protein
MQPMNQFTDPNDTIFVGGLSGYAAKDNDELRRDRPRGVQAPSLAAVSKWCGKSTLPSPFISFAIIVLPTNFCDCRLPLYARQPL